MRLTHTTLFVLVVMLMSMVGVVIGQEATPEPVPQIPQIEFVTPDGVDLNQVVATIGNTTITLGDYATRLRYEYMRYYRIFNELVAQEGPNVLDVRSPNNRYAVAILNVVNLLADKNQFPAEMYRTMVLEELYRQEAVARNVEITQCDLDTMWAGILRIEVTQECVFPDDFATQKANYIAFMIGASGISEAELENIVVGRVSYNKVRDLLRSEFTPEDQPAVRTRHIRVRQADVAQSVMERLNNGEDFMTVLADVTVDNNAAGNRGNLGFARQGQFVAEFDDAIFNNPVGLIQQPVQTQFGYHVIRVNEIGEMSNQVQLRQILLATEDEANIALRLLNEGADFNDLAARFSLDVVSRRNGGLLNPLERSAVASQYGETIAEAVFNAADGTLVGPFEIPRGWVVFRVESKTSSPSRVNASHILVKTREEAEAIIQRLNDGENFEDLAYELSTDPSARGYEGDTLAIFTDGQSKGLYIAEDAVRQEIDDAVFAEGVQVGDILGPIETRIGFYIIRVEEIGTRAYTEAQIEDKQADYIADWEKAQEASGRVIRTDLWRQFAPTDPLPSQVYPDLVQLNILLTEARENIRQSLERTNIINTLRTLRVEK